jgi:hypothetical protein
MNHLPTKTSLSSNRRLLVEAMQHLNFGRIEELQVCAGEPTFSPAPRLIQDIKIGGDNGPRPELDREDFVLRSSVVELFGHFDRLGNGTVSAIEVRYGLPARLIIERSAQELPR